MQLRAYQQEAVQWLLARKGRGILAYDMGLGKTPTTLSAIAQMRQGRVLIFAPKIACGVWLREAAQWLPAWPQLLYAGTKKERDGIWQQYLQSGGLLITNYQMAKELVERQAVWPVVVCDESHLLRNRKTGMFKAVNSFRSGAMVLLTGSPIMNHPTDLWTQLKLIAPKEFSSFWRFAQEHCEVNQGFFGWEIGDIKTPEHTQQALKPYVLRKTKEEVLTELPPKIRQTIPFPLAPGQRMLYDDLADDLMATIASMEGTDMLLAPNVIAKITRLRQICVTPILVGDIHSSAMFDALAEYAASDFDAGRPILVFTPFAEALDAIQERLQPLCGEHIYRIQGGMSSRDTNEQVEGFQRDLFDARALLCTVGVGSSFTATAAKSVYFMGSAWNPAQNLQCEDRAHRLGQKGSVVVRYLVGENTIDEHILATLDRKTTWAALALDPKMLLRPAAERVQRFVS